MSESSRSPFGRGGPGYSQAISVEARSTSAGGATDSSAPVVRVGSACEGSEVPEDRPSPAGGSAPYVGSARRELVSLFYDKFKADRHAELCRLVRKWDDAMMVGRDCAEVGQQIVRGVIEHYLGLEGKQLHSMATTILTPEEPDSERGGADE